MARRPLKNIDAGSDISEIYQ